jgi:regulator of RNase E activity RraA
VVAMGDEDTVVLTPEEKDKILSDVSEEEEQEEEKEDES